MNIGDAVQKLRARVARASTKMSDDVSSLLGLAGKKSASSSGGGAKAKTAPALTEASMNKARLFLNGLIEKSWEELDNTIVECKETEEASSFRLDQAGEDLSALGEEVANLMSLKTEANEGLSIVAQDIRQAEEELRTEEQQNYNRLVELQAKLQEHKDTSASFWALLSETTCTNALFLQQNKSFAGQGAPKRFGLCQMGQGDASGRTQFCDLATHRTIHIGSEQALPTARHLALLQEDQTTGAPAQTTAAPVASSSATTTTGVTTTMSAPGATPAPRTEQPVDYEPVCPCREVSGTGSNCQQLRKTFAVEWGYAQDQILTVEALISQSNDELNKAKARINLQMEVLVNAKAVYQTQLEHAISELNTAQIRQQQKEEERRGLEVDLENHIRSCQEKVEEILHSDICSCLTMRAEILKDSQDTPADQVVDCEVSDWSPSECSKSCDDHCGGSDTFTASRCGGVQTLTREIIIQANWGRACPSLTRTAKCNQVKCPVDCVLSEWSGFSKCTKDCESGVQGRTRSILTKPKHGGLVCNSVQEERPCNTQSCDRDCVLGDWTFFSACSSACGLGSQERRREVLVPIAGNGMCPSHTSRERLESRDCNPQACEVDSTCADKRDLVILVDGSGCKTADEFTALKALGKELVARFKSTYYGEEAMRVGLVQFGNGDVNTDKSITMSTIIQDLVTSTDLNTDVGAKITGLTATTGFSNLAQAFLQSQQMLQRGGRRDAQSAVLVLTTGTPAFEKMTEQQVHQLEDQGVLRYIVPVIPGGDRETDSARLASFASSPMEAHSVQIPGVDALVMDTNAWVVKVLSKTCQNLISPTARATAANANGYTLLAPGRSCGSTRTMQVLSTRTDAAGCARLAKSAGAPMFQVGQELQSGYCFAPTGLESNRQDLPSSSACKTHMSSTGCMSTLERSCPGQRMGTAGLLTPDTSETYECCCKQQLWQSMCAAYMTATGCSWTKEASCPGQPAGTAGTATDDGTEGYKCCCTLGLWQDKVELWNSWLTAPETPACPAAVGSALQTTNMYNLYGIKPAGA